MTERILHEFKAGYIRDGVILGNPTGTCEKCSRVDVPVICIDPAEMEYGYYWWCQNCLNEMFGILLDKPKPE